MDQERCDEYLAELEAEGKPEIAERLDCASLFFAKGGDLKMWSISVYYVVVTLTTSAPHPPPAPRRSPSRSPPKPVALMTGTRRHAMRGTDEATVRQRRGVSACACHDCG